MGTNGDKWNMLTQGNKSDISYIIKFDEYLNQCSAIELESPEQTLSRFWSGFRDDYCRQLIAYIDLDESRSFFHQTSFKDSSKTTNTSRPSHNQSFPVQSKPASSSSSVKPAGPPNTNPTTFEEAAASEQVEVNQRTLL